MEKSKDTRKVLKTIAIALKMGLPIAALAMGYLSCRDSGDKSQAIGGTVPDFGPAPVGAFPEKIPEQDIQKTNQKRPVKK